MHFDETLDKAGSGQRRLSDFCPAVQEISGERSMRQITTGDLVHTYGSFGMIIDYTVRLILRLDDEIDGNILKEAVVCTSKRYPYLMLKMHINDRDILILRSLIAA